MTRRKNKHNKKKKTDFVNLNNEKSKPIKCKYGDSCYNKHNCMFYHEGYSKVKIDCKFGKFCTRKDCFFFHPGEIIDERSLYSSKNIVNLLLSPENLNLENKDLKVQTKFNNFEKYFVLTVENHFSEYLQFIKEIEPKNVKAVCYKEKNHYFLSFQNAELNDSENNFSLLKHGKTFHFILKYCEENKRFTVYSKHSKQIFNSVNKNSRKKVNLRFYGYAGNFSSNLFSICKFYEKNKDETCQKYEKFLMNPEFNFKGNYKSDDFVYDENCNTTQNEIRKKMKNAVEIIQGPPGTGKSTIISSIIRNDLDYKTSRKKVIVTFLKNKAMESIIEKLTNHKILVFGAHNKLPPLCLQHEIYRKIDTNEQINKLRKEFKLFREKILVKISNLEEKMNEEETEPLKKELKSTKKSLSDRKANLERRVQMEIRREIESADVILSTISSLAKIINAANKSSANLKVHTAILDEAGCVEEISTFAIFNLLPDNVILIGDHLQLRPLYFNQEQNYAMTSKKSLMERAIEAGCKHSTLDIQYRMHKDIMTLVSNLFYGGKLKMGDIVRERKNGVLWKDVNSIEKVEKDGMYFNDGEIEECVRIYERERNFDSTQTIMIISFYNKQIEKLQNISALSIKDENLFINSVDSSQGSEADCVIISCVRNNGYNKIGFLSDPRRLNVAISRAKRVLYFVGKKYFYQNCNDRNWPYVTSMAVDFDK